ncbi:MAG: relaxase/mobilization nuclease domain-containing protein, partial [Eubacteriales bacterium]
TDFFAHFDGLRDVLDYTQKDFKTEQQFYVTGVNCDPAIAYEQMKNTKQRFQKTNGILAYHAYQAFAPGEATPESAHEIGVKLAQKLWGGRFEVVVTTHVDKHYLHNHFVLNSVSFMDGKRYYDNNATYTLMRQVSDSICREYSLSVIENPQRGKSRQYAEWKAEQEGKPTWRGLIREDLDKAIASSMTFTQFMAELKKQGYEVKTGVKYMAVRPSGKERFVRLKTLGAEYGEEEIKQRILRNRSAKHPEAIPEPKWRQGYVKGSMKAAKRVTGLQALYIHYLFKMGILSRKRASPKRTHFLLREDIRHLDEIIAQTRLLCTNQIENGGQLAAYRFGRELALAVLFEERKSVYNRIRSCRGEGQKEEYRRQISGLSKQIDVLQREVKLCAGILSRSGMMEEKMRRVKQKETEKREEEKTYEQRRRSGGPDRQHEPQGD